MKNAGMIESVSGQSYPDYIQDRVLKPVGLLTSTFRFSKEGNEFAWPHIGETFVRRASAHSRDRVFLPSSGLYANITDMMRWAAINLNHDSTLLSKNSYEEMFRPRVETTWSGIAMGLGWQLERDGERWLPRHPGGDAGFRALLTLYPKERRAIIIMSNGETTPRIEIRRVVEAIIAGNPVPLPTPSLTLRYPYLVPVLLALFGSLITMTIVLKKRRRKLAT